MNCRKTRLCLFSYFKNELSEKEKEEIKLHLKDCPDCAREAHEVENVVSLIENSLETLTPSPDFNQKLLSEVQNLSSAEESKEPGRAPFSLSRILGIETRFKWALVGSLVAIILVSVLWFTYKRSPIKIEPMSEVSEERQSAQLADREDRVDSLDREIFEKLMGKPRFNTKAYVLDNFRMVGSRGIDGRERLEDMRKRFIMETTGYRIQERRAGSHYVLPVVSTQQASAKVNY